MLGHNNPPTDADILKDYLLGSYSDQISEAARIEWDADALPKSIETDGQEVQIQDFIKRVNEGNKSLEKCRVESKEPYLSAGKTVDSFFKEYQARLDEIIKNLKSPLLAYKVEKARIEKEAADAEAKRLKEIADAQLLEATVQEALGDSSATEILKDAIKIDNEAEKVAAFSSRSHVKTASSSGGIKKRYVGEIENISEVDLISLRNFFTEDAIQKAINGFVSNGGRELTGVRIYEKQEVVVR